MPLHRILKSLDEPVRPEVTNQIITYMRSMPAGKEDLVSQCVTHLEQTQTLGSMLAVVHALNDGEFLLRCHTDVNENELVSEFDALFKEDKKTEEEKNKESKEPLCHMGVHDGDDAVGRKEDRAPPLGVLRR
jgi:hypothetical protein